MMCPFIQMNGWAVLGAYAASAVLGLLWYSPLLFGIPWLREVDNRNEEISRGELRRPLLLSILVPNLFSVLSLAILLAWLKPGGLFWALLIGGLVALGFCASTLLNLIYAEGRSRRLSLINIGYQLTALLVSAFVLATFS